MRRPDLPLCYKRLFFFKPTHPFRFSKLLQRSRSVLADWRSIRAQYSCWDPASTFISGPTTHFAIGIRLVPASFFTDLSDLPCPALLAWGHVQRTPRREL